MRNTAIFKMMKKIEKWGQLMEKTIEDVKTFAWQQMDAMWHDNYGDSTINMVKFSHNGYVVVNPWMDEKTEKSVNPYDYYGKKKTDLFIEEARRMINLRRMALRLEPVNHFNYTDAHGKIFCKRQGKVQKLSVNLCSDCLYLFGSLQGQGVECMWEDIVPPPSPCGYYVHDPQEEFVRVSGLIDEGILKKG